MIKTNIYNSKYKNQNAITLESDVLKAQFIPKIGSKMCSFIYKPLDIELLIQRENKKYKLEPYGGNYLKGECSGFDEMFPSIDECYYEDYPWEGTKIPDHGEVWSIPWSYKIEDNKLIMEVCGVRFPYKLKKIISIQENNILKIEYKLLNLSNFNFKFMWAAHPMFVLEEDSEIILPNGVKKIITDLSFNGRLGKYGDEYSWPSFIDKEGSKQILNIIRPKSSKSYEKYFIKGKLPQGWCSLKYAKSNMILTISFPVDKVPYLSILSNEGGWDNLYNIFIEPCTASFDRLDVAKLRNEYSSIEANSEFSWYLNLTLSEIKDFKRKS